MKDRAHTNTTNTHTSPPKPFPPKPFLPGRTRHVRPPAPELSPPGVTLPQLQRQRDARRVMQEGGDGTQAGQSASRGSAVRGTGGDRGSAQGHAQGVGQSTRGKEQGRKHGRGAEASISRGGESAGSGWRDAGQGAGKEPGHGKDVQGRKQGAQAGGHGAHGAERGTVGERGRSQAHGHGHRTGTGAPAVQTRAWVTAGETHGTDRGTEAWGPERDPMARTRAPWAPGDRQDGAWEPGGRAE